AVTPDAIERSTRSRLPDGALDDQAGACAGQARVRCGVQQHRRLGVTSLLGLLSPAPREARPAARRAGDQRLEAQDLAWAQKKARRRSEEHTSELQSRENLVCRLLLEKK